MLKTINDFICFGIASFACSLTAMGLLGVDPSVSNTTNSMCSYAKTSLSSCKTR